MKRRCWTCRQESNEWHWGDGYVCPVCKAFDQRAYTADHDDRTRQACLGEIKRQQDEGLEIIRACLVRYSSEGLQR